MFRNKKIVFAAILLFFANTVLAQEPAAAPQDGNNLLAVLLVFTTIVLAFVIWGMGQALITISRQVLEKNKAEKKALSVVLLLGFSLIHFSGHAQDAEAVPAAVPNYGGLSAANFYAFVGVIIIEVAAILFLAFSIRRMYQELLPEKVAAVAQRSTLLVWWSALDKKFFTKAVAVEKEQDVMLDHDYDGIRELDNALPPWWKYGFYITIVVGFIYLFHFHVSGAGKNPAEEYAAEMEKARMEKEIYEAGNKDKIDEQHVPMADAAGLTIGKEIFTTKCWACHGKQGEGGAGPNLTDEYWLHKGSLNDIYHSIKTGYPDKGMQSWAKEFTPKEMSYIASYIKTLKGTNPPNARAPQGDIYVEENQTDSIPALTQQ
jgi:cytochrome c oxidase cbb3-type subunit III